jgi:predicted transcriptional regulator
VTSKDTIAPKRKPRRTTPQPVMTVYLSDELVAWIRSEAERRKTSQSKFIRSVLEDVMNNEVWK